MSKGLWQRLMCFTSEMHLPSPDSSDLEQVHCRHCGNRIRQDRDGVWYCVQTCDARAVATFLFFTAAILVATSFILFF
jgi:hypothetical protein